MAPQHLSFGDESWQRMTFCPHCGRRLAHLHRFGAERPSCEGCGLVLFRTPAAAAAAVVVRGRELLLVRRGIQPYRGQWGFPAGYQEYGETPAETAVRETREETGLEVAVRRVLDVMYTRDDPRKEGNLVVYLAEVVAGSMRAADDADDVRFFSLDALPDRIAFVNNRLVIERLRAEFPTGDLE